MTKYKEFLMAHGAILECNSAELARDENYDVEFIIPCVTDTGFAIKYYHVYNNVPDLVVYDRSGACVNISYSGDDSYRKYVRWDTEFINWVKDTSSKTPTILFAVTVYMYDKDERIRLAFKHMRAGIMDEKTFYKLVLRHYQRRPNN